MPRRVLTKDDITRIAKDHSFGVKFKSMFQDATEREILQVTIFDTGDLDNVLFDLEFDCLSQEDRTFAIRDLPQVQRAGAFLTEIGT
jgi:hypothetical protein